jgi:prepilin-type N-terminal cleavage/methylation domain-containing protein
MKRNGFSIIEFLVVITMLCILAAVIGPRIPKFVKHAYINKYVDEHIATGKMLISEGAAFKKWTDARFESLPSFDNSEDVSQVYSQYMNYNYLPQSSAVESSTVETSPVAGTIPNLGPVDEDVAITEDHPVNRNKQLEQVAAYSFDAGNVYKFRDKETGDVFFIAIANNQIVSITTGR